MKRLLFILLFFPVVAYGQFRMVSSTVTLVSTVNDSTYIVDVDFFSDQTAKGYFASGITADYRVFSQTGQLYDITAASNLTLSSGELTIVEIDNVYTDTEGAPVGQILVYDPQGDFITYTPFGNSNMGQVLQQAIGTYNAVVSAENPGGLSEWSDSETYVANDQVKYNGRIFTNKTGSNTITPPTEDATNWEVTNKTEILNDIDGRDTISQASHGFSVGDPLWYSGDYILAQDTGVSVRVDGIVVEVIDANTFVRQRSGKFTLSSHGFTENIQLYVQPDGTYSTADTSNSLAYGFAINANEIQIGLKSGLSISTLNRRLGSGNEFEIPFFDNTTTNLSTNTSFKYQDDTLKTQKFKINNVSIINNSGILDIDGGLRPSTITNPYGGSNEIGAVINDVGNIQSKISGGDQFSTVDAYTLNRDSLINKRHIFLNLTYQPPILNKTTGSKRAYSLRVINSEYTGPLIRIRNNANTDSIDVYAVGGVIDTNAIESFAAGSRAYVTKWYDQSGNSSDVFQYSTVDQPEIANASGQIYRINEQPTLFFSGDYLFDTEIGLNGSALSAALVNYRTSVGVWFPFTYGAFGSVYGGGFNALRTDGNFTTTHSKGQNGTGGSPYIKSYYGNAINTQYINMFSLGVDSVQTWTNDTINPLQAIPDFQKGIVEDFESPSNTIFCLGCNSNSLSSHTSDTYVQELIVWTTQQYQNQSAIFSELNGFYDVYPGAKTIVQSEAKDVILPIPNSDLLGKKFTVNFTSNGDLSTKVIVADTSIILVNSIQMDSLFLSSGGNSSTEFQVVSSEDGSYYWKVINSTDISIFPQSQALFTNTRSDILNITLGTEKRIILNNGAPYRIVESTNTLIPVDSISQIPTNNGFYAQLQPINGWVAYSWFKKSETEAPHLVLQRAFNYMDAFPSIKGVFGDESATFTDEVSMPEGGALKTAFNWTFQTDNEPEHVMYTVDLNDTSKDFINFVASKVGNPDGQAAGTIIQDAHFQVISPCRAVIDMDQPYMARLDGIKIEGSHPQQLNNEHQFGITLEARSTLTTLRDIDISGSDSAAIWMKGGNTLKIYAGNFRFNRIGVRLSGGGAELTMYGGLFEGNSEGSIQAYGVDRLRLYDVYNESEPKDTSLTTPMYDFRNVKLLYVANTHPIGESPVLYGRTAFALDTINQAMFLNNNINTLTHSITATCNTRSIVWIGNSETTTTKIYKGDFENICDPDIITVINSTDFNENTLPYSRYPVADITNSKASNFVIENTVISDTLYTSNMVLKGAKGNLYPTSNSIPDDLDVDIVVTQNAVSGPPQLGVGAMAATIEYNAAISGTSSWSSLSTGGVTMKAGEYWTVAFWARKSPSSPEEARCRYLIRDLANTVDDNTAYINDTIWRRYFVRLKMTQDQTSFSIRHSGVTDTMTVEMVNITINKGYWPLGNSASETNESPVISIPSGLELDIQGTVTNVDSLKWTHYSSITNGDTITFNTDKNVIYLGAGDSVYIDESGLTSDATLKVIQSSGIGTVFKADGLSNRFYELGTNRSYSKTIGTGSVKELFYNKATNHWYTTSYYQSDIPIEDVTTTTDTIVVYRGMEIAMDGTSGSYTVQLDLSELNEGESFNIKVDDIGASTVTVDVLNEASVVQYEGDPIAATHGFTGSYTYVHCFWRGSVLYITR